MNLQASPLLKVPLLLLSSVCAQISFTSPNPPAKHSEQKKYGDANWLAAGSSLRYVSSTAMFKTISHLLNAVEIVSIVAQEYFPNLARSQVPIMSTLPHVYISSSYAYGIVLMSACALLRLACYRELGRHFTFELSLREEHQLITTGPYSIVRHPSYTACILHFIAAILQATGPGSWWLEGGYWRFLATDVVLLVWAYIMTATTVFLVARTNEEDSLLRAEFPKQWEQWSRQTPSKLFPYLY